jgi:hypothetical protein
MHQNLCREATTYNRPANGKADYHGPYINRNTVVLTEPLLYSHVPNPVKSLDHSIMPTLTHEQIVNMNKRKPTIDTSTYYISNNYINTLNENPLVNDIYHQKNYN